MVINEEVVTDINYFLTSHFPLLTSIRIFVLEILYNEKKNLEAIQKEEIGNKNQNLILGIVFDAIGMLSFSIPLVGEFSDVVWLQWLDF